MTHANMRGSLARVWATAPETEGVACGVGDPVEEALCKNPELRGLKPAELARALRVSPGAAQVAILRMAARTTGKRISFEGLSLDEALGMAGGAAQKTSMKFSEDAAGFADVVKVARPYFPILAVVLVVILIFATSAVGEDA